MRDSNVSPFFYKSSFYNTSITLEYGGINEHLHIFSTSQE